MRPIKPGKWVGFDFDGTLAYDVEDMGALGEPIPPMVELAKQYIAAGVEVRILTARVWVPADERWKPELARECGALRMRLMAWTELHLGKRLKITCEKDPMMSHFYDDRAVEVRRNNGELMAVRCMNCSNKVNMMDRCVDCFAWYKQILNRLVAPIALAACFPDDISRRRLMTLGEDAAFQLALKYVVT